MKINLQRGQFPRVMDGAGSTVTAHGGAVWITEQNSARDVVLGEGRIKRLLLALSLAATTLTGCAQFAAEEQSPYPTRFRSDNRHPA